MDQKIERAPKPPEPPAPSGTPMIPVKELSFSKGHTIDLPGRPLVDGVRATAQGNGTTIKLFFDPRLRHHRIEVSKPNQATPDVRYVPEAWCSWVPL